ncbi:MAG: glycosyltransferase [Bacteroidia bacterium]|nr:glycosyltransferase [Bacteroidota bacterium]MBP6640099.1 glycosyltransferase [Bacteroidia bacterium]
MGIAILVLYFVALTFILMYSGVQVHLAILYTRFQKREKMAHEALPAMPVGKPWPMVTVQLPIFNEMYVVERLIDSIAAFDYPADRLEVQVLDDSTDETVQITAKKVAEWKAKGLDIVHVHRSNRQGFKAGALKEGMEKAKGEFIAIFDADFLPHPNFLKTTIPHFHDPKIGVVQTRWEHINRNYSILTKLQAFALDAHFSVEQQGRNSMGYFINFNGTAGVWRRTTIDDAGGWQSDTLTEDLDLSYRAQLKGWRFKFLENLDSPAELPAAMGAVKSQQFRWTKGAAETARKNLGKVLMAKLPFGTKVHATFHLLNSMLFICIVLNAVLSVPLVFYNETNPIVAGLMQYASIFSMSLLALILFFWVSRRNRLGGRGIKGFLRFVVTFPVFWCVTMGLSLHNAIATMEGYIGRKTPFIRTPKFALTDGKDDWKTRTKYISRRISPITVLEGLMLLYIGFGIGMEFWYGSYGMLPFHILLIFGYGLVFYFSVRHSLRATH